MRADEALTAAFDAGADGLLDRLSSHPALADRLAPFLRDYGYRGPERVGPRR